ncbi:MAG: hypothetical protein OES46_08195 [Gammaproteobacteria bacterium]|nr:hypothetical protein [Gammaproteobacteria bacterium]
MSAKHPKLWRLWLAFYLAWTAITAVWVYDDANQAAQILLKSNNLKADHQIAACEAMNELAALEDRDQKLIDLYFTVYQKNESDDVLEQIRAFDALEIYFLAERATGRHPHLDHDVHRILRDCASARVRIDKATRERNGAAAGLVSYVGIVFLPPLVVLLVGMLSIWVSARLKTN